MAHEKSQKTVSGTLIPKCSDELLFLYDHRVNFRVHRFYTRHTIKMHR